MSETGTTIRSHGVAAPKIGCAGLTHVPDAAACPRGDWSGLVVRRWGWPQKQISDAALAKHWGVLNSPLGAFTIGSVGRSSESQLKDLPIVWPESAALRYYGATSFEVHYRIENATAPTRADCARFGIDLMGLSWRAAYSPADNPDGPVDLAAERRRIARKFQGNEPVVVAFEDYNRNEHRRSGYNRPLDDRILGTSLLPALPDSDSLQKCVPLVGAGIPADCDCGYHTPRLVLDFERGTGSDGRGRRLYSEASRGGVSMLDWYAQTRGGRESTVRTAQYDPNPPEKTRLFGVGCDLFFFTDADGFVIDPKTNDVVMVTHPYSRGPYGESGGMAFRLPLMYYNVRIAAEFRLRAFLVQSSGEYCLSDAFAVHVNFQPAVSRGPSLTVPANAATPPVEVIGERATYRFKRRSEVGPLGSKPFQNPPADNRFLAPTPQLDLKPCPAWERSTYGEFLDAFQRLARLVTGDDRSDQSGLMTLARRSLNESLTLIRALAKQMTGWNVPRITTGLQDTDIDVGGVTPYESETSPMENDLEDLFVWRELVVADVGRIAIELADRTDQVRAAGEREGLDSRVSAAEHREYAGRLLLVARAILGLELAHDVTSLFHAAVALRATDFPVGEIFDAVKPAWEAGELLIPQLRMGWEKVILHAHPEAGLTRSRRPSLPPYWADMGKKLVSGRYVEPIDWIRNAFPDAFLLDDPDLIDALDRLTQAAAARYESALSLIREVDRRASTQYRRGIVRWAAIAVEVILAFGGRRVRATSGGSLPRPAAASLVVSGAGYPAAVIAARGGVTAARVLEALAAAGLVAQSSIAMFARSKSAGHGGGARELSSGGSKKLNVPQGVSKEQFDKISRIIREAVDEWTDSVWVHGSRARGNAEPNADLDIAVKMSKGAFKKFLDARFGRIPASKTKAAAKLFSQTNDIVRARDAGLALVRNRVSSILNGMDIHLSVVKTGGRFDNGPWIELTSAK